MPSGKKHATHVNLGDLVQSALLKKGLRLPVSEEEVAAAEDEVAKGDVRLPPSVADPPDFLTPPRPLKPRFARHAREPTELEEEMARAAREGGEITPDIEEKMRRDRLEAEAESDESEE